ncbi:MAG: response regulator [Cyanobacteriota bacterium]|nr:response regulator [Cyanobacteriota bacterium]
MAGNKILVIDDSKVIRVRVGEMLPKGNFTVLEAKDGQQGLQLIRKERPNLIMLDFLLPKVSGWEVFQKIQSEPTLKQIPLVVMSGRKEEVTEKIPEPFDAHYFAFLEKPFEKKELSAAIKGAFELSKKRPVEDTSAEASAGGSGDSAEIKAMQAQMKKMQGEILALKKQMAQLIAVVKQKLK